MAKFVASAKCEEFADEAASVVLLEDGFPGFVGPAKAVSARARR